MRAFIRVTLPFRRSFVVRPFFLRVSVCVWTVSFSFYRLLRLLAHFVRSACPPVPRRLVAFVPRYFVIDLSAVAQFLIRSCVPCGRMYRGLRRSFNTGISRRCRSLIAVPRFS